MKEIRIDIFYGNERVYKKVTGMRLDRDAIYLIDLFLAQYDFRINATPAFSPGYEKFHAAYILKEESTENAIRADLQLKVTNLNNEFLELNKELNKSGEKNKDRINERKNKIILTLSEAIYLRERSQLEIGLRAVGQYRKVFKDVEEKIIPPRVMVVFCESNVTLSNVGGDLLGITTSVKNYRREFNPWLDICTINIGHKDDKPPLFNPASLTILHEIIHAAGHDHRLHNSGYSQNDPYSIMSYAHKDYPNFIYINPDDLERLDNAYFVK